MKRVCTHLFEDIQLLFVHKYLELEAHILQAGRGYEYCVLGKYEPLTPSIRDSGAENLVDFTAFILLDMSTPK